jgi:hypothetical protein
VIIHLVYIGVGSIQHATAIMNDEIIANIRSRVERCRYLAGMINDQQAAEVLRQMADEGDADIKRLEAERDLQSK